MAHLMLFLMPFRRLTALVLSTGFAIGFYSQYVLDTNAWSELLAIPMQPVLVSEFCALLARRIFTAESDPRFGDRRGSISATQLIRTLAILSALAVGVLYAYPEM